MKVAPEMLGDLSVQLGEPMPGDQPGDETDSYLLLYLRLVGSQIEVVPAPGSGAPFQRAGFEHPTVLGGSRAGWSSGARRRARSRAALAHRGPPVGGARRPGQRAAARWARAPGVARPAAHARARGRDPSAKRAGLRVVDVP
jgi:hypothetical protein